MNKKIILWMFVFVLATIITSNLVFAIPGNPEFENNCTNVAEWGDGYIDSSGNPIVGPFTLRSGTWFRAATGGYDGMHINLTAPNQFDLTRHFTIKVRTNSTGGGSGSRLYFGFDNATYDDSRRPYLFFGIDQKRPVVFVIVLLFFKMQH